MEKQKKDLSQINVRRELPNLAAGVLLDQFEIGQLWPDLRELLARIDHVRESGDEQEYRRRLRIYRGAIQYRIAAGRLPKPAFRHGRGIGWTVGQMRAWLGMDAPSPGPTQADRISSNVGHAGKRKGGRPRKEVSGPVDTGAVL
ncbi:MAG TPA: hypothetical protein VN280_04735 [Variovorax sp.]|nr:hypothetical protein [Variovorax sp.]